MMLLVASAFAAPPIADHTGAALQPTLPDLDEGDLPVVGGEPAGKARWDDAVGIVMAGYVGCTGTLIGPKVVITAGHCLPSQTGYPITDVLVGSKNWLDDLFGEMDEGVELVPVADYVEYPNSQATFDVGILLLEREVKKAEPRKLALECVIDEHLYNGAPAWIVGFGVTQENGRGYNSLLNEAPTEVVDKSCKETRIDGILTGCHDSVRPAGELAAGGNGTDACYGDSGGPLYLETPEGEHYLVGVTSRAFLGVDWQYPCRDGGIWARPDAIIDWIEEQVGKRELAYPSCNVPPEPVVPALVTPKNTVGAVTVAVNDPDGDGDAALIEIVEPPEHGSATVDGLNVVYTPLEGYIGADSLTISVVDGGTDSARTGAPQAVEVVVPVTVVRRGLFGGCAHGELGALGLAALAAAALVRRRRR